MSKEFYIGIMSGTSMDGIDVALCEIDENNCRCIAYKEYAFGNHLKALALHLISHPSMLEEVGRLDVMLAEDYAKAVNHLLEEHDLLSKDIRAIGSHGQTLWHQPEGRYPFSMQLGNPSLLATLTGINVVADFRAKDIANGGQGAPFAPAFHQFIFSDLERSAVLNIGGMANLTILGDTLLGYDTGCGNVLMDMWISEKKDVSYDKDGLWAKSGTVHLKLLEKMLSDSYFKLNYPKSTGREYFNKNFLIKYREALGKIPDEDIQATLLALSVESISHEVQKFNIDRLLLCGGGAKNVFLLAEFRKKLPTVEIELTSDYGVSGDALEAMIFAWLAYKRLRRESVDLKTVTGTKNNTILGGVYAAD